MNDFLLACQTLQQREPDWALHAFVLPVQRQEAVVAEWNLMAEINRLRFDHADPMVKLLRLSFWKEKLASLENGRPASDIPSLRLLSKTTCSPKHLRAFVNLVEAELMDEQQNNDEALTHCRLAVLEEEVPALLPAAWALILKSQREGPHEEIKAAAASVTPSLKKCPMPKVFSPARLQALLYFRLLKTKKWPASDPRWAQGHSLQALFLAANALLRK